MANLVSTHFVNTIRKTLGYLIDPLKERAAASERWAELCYALAGVFELLASLAVSCRLRSSG